MFHQIESSNPITFGLAAMKFYHILSWLCDFIFPEKNFPSNFPVIIKHPALKGEEKGRIVILPCEAAGNPTPQIHWFKDFIPVDMTNPRITLVDDCK